MWTYWVIMPRMLPHLPLPEGFRPRVLADDIMTVRNPIGESAGVGLLPQFVAEPYVAMGHLSQLRSSHPLGAATLAIVHPSSGQVSRKVAAFRDFMVERFEARPLGS